MGSEGALADFRAFQEWANQTRVRQQGVAIRFKLNGDLHGAFHQMVVSDALVFGPSSFPALAADYNPGRHYILDKFLHTVGKQEAVDLPVPTADQVASILAKNQPVGVAPKTAGPGQMILKGLAALKQKLTHWFP